MQRFLLTEWSFICPIQLLINTSCDLCLASPHSGLDGSDSAYGEELQRRIMNALSSGWGILFLLGRQPRSLSPLAPELDNGSWLTTSTKGGAMELRLCFGATVIVR